MQMHQLQRTHARRRHRQIGRGGKRGKTSGRGTKGQLARAGRKLRPELRDLIKKIPKMRGRGKNSNTSIQAKPRIVTLAMLEQASAAKVTPAVFFPRAVRGPKVKILGTGKLARKVTVAGFEVSAAARAAIEAAGGAVVA